MRTVIMPKPKLTAAMRGALWNIQRDGGLMLTHGVDVESPYTTKKGRAIHARMAMALIAAGELVAEGYLFPGEAAGSWQVAHPVDQVAP